MPVIWPCQVSLLLLTNYTCCKHVFYLSVFQLHILALLVSFSVVFTENTYDNYIWLNNSIIHICYFVCFIPKKSHFLKKDLIFFSWHKFVSRVFFTFSWPSSANSVGWLWNLGINRKWSSKFVILYKNFSLKFVSHFNQSFVCSFTFSQL